MVVLCLESWTRQWHHLVEVSGNMSLDDSVWPVEQASIIYININISCLLCVKMRTEQLWLFFITCQCPLESTVIIVLCNPQSQKLKKQYQGNGGLNLQPCPWDFNFVIDWHNLSHNGWAHFHIFFSFFFDIVGTRVGRSEIWETSYKNVP